jgi:hypothetical protein
MEVHGGWLQHACCVARSLNSSKHTYTPPRTQNGVYNLLLHSDIKFKQIFSTMIQAIKSNQVRLAGMESITSSGHLKGACACSLSTKGPGDSVSLHTYYHSCLNSTH